jgi:hypothetical protein
MFLMSQKLFAPTPALAPTQTSVVKRCLADEPESVARIALK